MKEEKKDVELISQKPIESVPDGVHTSKDIESNLRKSKQPQVPNPVGSTRG